MVMFIESWKNKKQFIQELVELVESETNSFSDVMFQLCFCLYHLSSKTYRFLRNLFPLLCESSLYNRFSNDVRANENLVTDCSRNS